MPQSWIDPQAVSYPYLVRVTKAGSRGVSNRSHLALEFLVVAHVDIHRVLQRRAVATDTVVDLVAIRTPVRRMVGADAGDTPIAIEMAAINATAVSFTKVSRFPTLDSLGSRSRWWIYSTARPPSFPPA